MIRQETGSPRPRDPGLQAERTALAWNRTGLAMLVNALLALRSGWVNRETPLTVLAFALLLAAVATICYGAWRQRHLLTGYGKAAPSAIAIATATVVTFVTCLAGIASTLCLTAH